MAIKLHGHPMSPAAKRALLTLAEKGLDYELVVVDFATGAHKKEPFLSLNPFGQLPAFEDGDLTLFESRAISKYVAHAYADKGTQLISADPKKMGVIGVWMEVESLRFDAEALKLCNEILIKPMMGMKPDDAVVEELQGKLSAILDVYEARLSKSKYLAGEDYTLADLHHIPLLDSLIKSNAKALFDARPCVAAWVAAILARPATQKIIGA